MPDPRRPASPRQIIRNASWLVAWDEAVQSHVYRRDADLTDVRAGVVPLGRYLSSQTSSMRQPL